MNGERRSAEAGPAACVIYVEFDDLSRGAGESSSLAIAYRNGATE
jgi:hypothetical protein